MSQKSTAVHSLSPPEVLSVLEALRHPGEKKRAIKMLDLHMENTLAIS